MCENQSNCSSCPFLYNNEYCLINKEYIDNWNNIYKELEKCYGISEIYKES